jgi:hypothetical protein
MIRGKALKSHRDGVENLKAWNSLTRKIHDVEHVADNPGLFRVSKKKYY